MSRKFKSGVDFLTLRKVNKLTQNQLAFILGVSRGYISQVEKGRCGVSDEMIESILFHLREEQHNLDSRPLFPPCWRLFQLHTYLVSIGDKSLIQDFNQRFLPEEDYFISYKSWEDFIEGQEVITPALAYAICGKYHQVSYEWLAEGRGDMLISPEKLAQETTEDFLKRLDKKLDVIISMINGCK